MKNFRFWNKVISLAMVLAFIVALIPPQNSVSASASELFFSEYIEGSSNNKALEIFNATGAAVDLAAGGYNVYMSFNGGTSTLTINLTGSVSNGDVYVLAHSSAAAAILSQADQTNGSGWFNGDDAVVLRKGTVVLDVIGQVGVDPGTQWPGGGENDTLRRMDTICVGDTIQDDAFDASVEWVIFAQDTFDGLGSHTANCDGNGDPIDPVINEFSASTIGNPDFEYIEVFGDPITDYSSFTLLEIEGDSNATKGVIDRVFPIGTTDSNGLWTTGAGNLSIENGTITLMLVDGFTGTIGNDIDGDDDGVIDFMPWGRLVDTVSVYDGGTGDITYGVPVLFPNYDGVSSFAPGGASRIPDGFDTNSTTDWVRNDFDLAGIPGFTGSLGPGEALNTPGVLNEVYVAPPEMCGDPSLLVSEVQGSGLFSPYDDQGVAVEGVVTADFQYGGGPDSGDLGGFYIQDTMDVTDADPLTSNGMYVYDPSGMDVAVGDKVRVRGTVDEFVTNNGASSMTEIKNIVQVWNCGISSVPAPVDILLPVNSLGDFEAYEGMLVRFPQALHIGEYFNFDRFNEIILTTTRQSQPTAIFEPGSPDYYDLADLNARSRIMMDDGRSSQNSDPAIHPNSFPFDLSNRFRGGDTLQSLTGVLDETYSYYRIQPTQVGIYTATNPRPAVPDAVGGSLKVASFNVLNYFTTINTGGALCGPPGYEQACRGADNTEEFTRQRDKIISALSTINADVVGLIEIENNPSEAVADLVSGLNALMGAGTYDYVDTGFIGTDAIKVALIYKPATVSLVGTHAILDSSVDARFLDDKNRPVLAQTFMDSSTGGVFTVAVNHLKSKGSDCNSVLIDGVYDVDNGDGQGNCNLTRREAAAALVDWLATDPTGSGDSDYLIIGDLNSYDKEDPIDVLVNAGYTDLIKASQGEYAYSYLFDGQLGYLDYALASPGLVGEVTGTTVWHINADEPDLIDYDTSFKGPNQDAIYAPDAFRASDHDPVIVGLDVCDEIVPTIAVSITPDTLWSPNHKYVEVAATVTVDDNFDPDPTITLVSVESNEPDNGVGDGNTTNDIVIVDTFHFKLRAERSENGSGRVYTITYMVEDDCGNVSFGTTTVTVPKSQSKKK